MSKPLAACFLTAVLIGCGSDPEITAVRIVASYSQAISVDQLAFAVGTAGELHSFDAATIRPQKAASPLRSPQSFVVYLPDRLAGMTVVCGVQGRRGGTAVGEGWGRPVELVLKEEVTCDVLLEDGQSGPDGGIPPMGDGAMPSDGVDASDARAGDAPVVSPPDAPEPPTGCAVGDRKAFTDRGFFPTVAGCGASPMPYSQALQTAGGVCATDWHWCRPHEMSALSDKHLPSQVDGSCSWLDSRGFGCQDRRKEYSQLGCVGMLNQTSSVGEPNSGTACALGLGCGDPWKFAVPLDRFNNSSVTGGVGEPPCMNHVAFQCAGTLTPSNCWITCCKD